MITSKQGKLLLGSKANLSLAMNRLKDWKSDEVINQSSTKLISASEKSETEYNLEKSESDSFFEKSVSETTTDISVTRFTSDNKLHTSKDTLPFEYTNTSSFQNISQDGNHSILISFHLK